MLITFEGIDGSGKTTQSDMLARHFKNAGKPFIKTREPGGTDFAESIRNVLLHSSYCLDAKTQLLLILATRRQHCNNIILPAIADGNYVICDRFIHSTLAYQGYGLGLDLDFINKMHKEFDCMIEPEITIIIDACISCCKTDSGDRFEKMQSDFFKKVANGYKDLAKKSNKLFIIKRDENDTLKTHRKIVELTQEKIETKT